MTREELQRKLDALQEKQAEEIRRHTEAMTKIRSDYAYAQGAITARLQTDKGKESVLHKEKSMAIEYERQQLFADYKAAREQTSQQAGEETHGSC